MPRVSVVLSIAAGSLATAAFACSSSSSPSGGGGAGSTDLCLAQAADAEQSGCGSNDDAMRCACENKLDAEAGCVNEARAFRDCVAQRPICDDHAECSMLGDAALACEIAWCMNHLEESCCPRAPSSGPSSSAASSSGASSTGASSSGASSSGASSSGTSSSGTSSSGSPPDAGPPHP